MANNSVKAAHLLETRGVNSSLRTNSLYDHLAILRARIKEDHGVDKNNSGLSS